MQIVEKRDIVKEFGGIFLKQSAISLPITADLPKFLFLKDVIVR